MHLAAGRQLAADVLAFVGLVGSVPLLVTLLSLPGGGRDWGQRARYALDGVILAASGFFTVWLLVIEPEFGYREALASFCLPVVAPGALLTLTLGVGAVVLVRAHPPRGRAAMVVGSAMLMVAGLLSLAVGLRFQQRPLPMVGVIALIGGASLFASALRRLLKGGAQPEPTSHAVAPRFGTALSTVPVAVALLASVYRVTVGGQPSIHGMYAAAAVTALLICRQALTMHDARRYAEELAKREEHYRSTAVRESEAAHTDSLTGLGNRRALLRTLHTDPRRAHCTLLTLDLDGFKSVNDVRGHDVGDAVLVEVACRLRANLRPEDVPTRLGGDEFAVLMWSGPAAAYIVADRLLKALAAPYQVEENTVFISASIGLAGCGTAEDVPSLLRNADVALRSAKREGKNRVEEYDFAVDQWMRRRLELASELRGAAARGELSLVYQPVVDLPSRRPVGVEALLRWCHPVLGMVEPSEFIPVAEESELVAELGVWTLHQACRRLSGWLESGHDLWLAVNMSARQLHLPEFLDLLAGVLRTHQIPAHRLTLEITEHRVVRDVKALADRITEIQGLGVRVALDDFGSGYSSLAQLRQLPVDVLKIDRELLAGTGRVEPLADVVVQLGQRLGLEVVAEGIEEQSQLEALEAAGCKLGQGFLLCRPLPVEHLEAYLRDTSDQDVGRVDSGREIRQGG